MVFKIKQDKMKQDEDGKKIINLNSNINFGDDTDFQSDQFKRLQDGDGHPEGCPV